jgi:murein L,D-transpeptidase YafK
MHIALRRLGMCLRMCGLVAAGILVAHAWAVRVSSTKPHVQPLTSIASTAEAVGRVAAEAPAGPRPEAETKVVAETTEALQAEPSRRAPAQEKAPTQVTTVIAEHRNTSETVAPTETVTPIETANQMPVLGYVAADRSARLAAKGLSAGNAVMIRIFKAESELEVWMQKAERFELFATYPICKWSGKLGPKLHEGDRQAPEGLYAVAMPQIHRKGRWPRALNIGFPNAFDRAMERTGSLILVHGGCSSIGCFAMTNPKMDEIYQLTELALQQGQQFIPVHVFPFRMTEANLKAHADSEWQPFWRNLKDAYDVFERTRVPPQVNVCGKRYVVREGGTAQPATVSSDPLEQQMSDCVDTATELGRQASLENEVESVTPSKARRIVSKTQRRRSAGRNVRKNYAEARKTRMAAHIEKVRSKQASATKTQR